MVPSCAGAREPHFARQPRKPEVEQLCLTLGRDEYVTRFDVAVNESEPVCFNERVSDLVRDVAREPDRQRSGGRGAFEIDAGNQFHHEVRDGRAVRPASGFFAGINGRDDVGVLQAADGALRRKIARVCAGFDPGKVEACLDRNDGSQLPVFARYTTPIPPTPTRSSRR